LKEYGGGRGSRWEDSDVAGSSWLAGILAAVMIVTAAYCAARLALARRWQRETAFDADGLHVAMGTAMAGMLVPRLSPLPATMWEALFAGAAGWFAWQAIRARGGHPPGRSRSPHPVPHLVECAAMLYMLLAVPGPRPAGPGTGTPMPGMGGSPGAGVSFPALAIVLALFMAGYVVWATDQLSSLTRIAAAGTAQTAARDAAGTPRTFATVSASGTQNAATTCHQHPGTSTSREQLGATPMLAPRLAACYKIAMGITMGYMLILML
jgi:Domain of unknown function (DUF5134)